MKDPLGVCFIDTETTGTDPRVHEVWDIGLIVDGVEYEYHVRPKKPAAADSTALRIGRFYLRSGRTDWRWSDPSAVATFVAALTADRFLVGIVPSFDAEFLRAFLVANGQAPAWHYQLIDAEVLAAGRCAAPPPWNTDLIARVCEVPPQPDDERHTAIGDARFAKALYEAALRQDP
jgi:DNA polymerase III epsilon subunit-like protein